MIVFICVCVHVLIDFLRGGDSGDINIHVCKHVFLLIMRLHVRVGKDSQHTFAWISLTDIET